VGLDLLTVETSWLHSVRHATICRIPLDDWSAHRRNRYLHNTQRSQQTDRRRDSNPNPRRQATSEPRLRPRGYWDQQTI